MYEIRECTERMQKSVAHIEKELQWLQVGRATPSLVDSMVVHTSYGDMQINAVASVTVPDSQTLRIEPRDKSNIAALEKCIYDANAWLTPQNQGDYLMISIPPLTGERRQEMAKQVRSMGEDAKATLRKIRQDEMKSIKTLATDKQISEDEQKMFEWQVDDDTKLFSGKIDALVQAKSDDILKV